MPLPPLTPERLQAALEHTLRHPPAMRFPVLAVPSDAVAADGVLPMEPVWTTLGARQHTHAVRPPEFVGAVSGGSSSRVEVVSGSGPSRRSHRELVVSSTCTRCFAPDAAVQARRLLRVAASFPEGTIVEIDPEGGFVAVGFRSAAEQDALLLRDRPW